MSAFAVVLLCLGKSMDEASVRGSLIRFDQENSRGAQNNKVSHYAVSAVARRVRCLDFTATLWVSLEVDEENAGGEWKGGREGGKVLSNLQAAVVAVRSS